MDQGGTWHGGGPWSRPHCARWALSSPPVKKGTVPPLDAHFYCGQMAGLINMPLGTEVGLGSGDIVLGEDPVPPPPPKKGSPQFSAHVYCGLTDTHLSYC